VAGRGRRNGGQLCHSVPYGSSYRLVVLSERSQWPQYRALGPGVLLLFPAWDRRHQCGANSGLPHSRGAVWM